MVLLFILRQPIKIDNTLHTRQNWKEQAMQDLTTSFFSFFFS